MKVMNPYRSSHTASGHLTARPTNTERPSDAELYAEITFLDKMEQAGHRYKKSVLVQRGILEGNTLGLTPSQHRRIGKIQTAINGLLCIYDDPSAISDWLRENKKVSGRSRQWKALLSGLPQAGGDYEVTWARHGLQLVTLLGNDYVDEKTSTELYLWSRGALEWTPYPPDKSDEEIQRGIFLASLGGK